MAEGESLRDLNADVHLFIPSFMHTDDDAYAYIRMCLHMQRLRLHI